MKHARVSVAVLLAIAIARQAVAGSSWCPSFTHLVNMKTGSDTIGVTKQQAREILKFARTMPGIQHHIEFVDATKYPEVEVWAGPHEQLRGDYVRIRREPDGHWKVLERAPWDWKGAASGTQ